MDYTKTLNSKRVWQVSNPTCSDVKSSLTPEDKEKARILLTKFLALSIYELPVGEFITHYCQKIEPKDINLKNLLESNANDELRHDQQLDILIDSFKGLDKDLFFSTSKEFNYTLQELKSLSHYVEPILISAVLEISLFVPALTAFRMLGNSAFVFISNDINRDERTHIQTNFSVVDMFNISNHNPKLNSIRRNTIDLITNHLPDIHPNKYLSRQFWFKQSKELYESRTAKDLKQDTSVGIYTAFFEIPNTNLSGGY